MRIDYCFRWLCLAWLVASLAFKFYVANLSDYEASYGAIGGVIVLLLWFYVSGLALLVGAELDSEIAHASRGRFTS